MVELQPSKLIAWVRFPSPAHKKGDIDQCRLFYVFSSLKNSVYHNEDDIYLSRAATGIYQVRKLPDGIKSPVPE